MPEEKKLFAKTNESTYIEDPPGIRRTTLAYNQATMVCHFYLSKGSKIPLHNHKAAQSGMVIKGKIRFFLGDDSGKESGESFIAGAGTGFAFAPFQYHGAEVLEDSENVETFAPLRPEYIS